MENLILTYELKGKARTRPKILAKICWRPKILIVAEVIRRLVIWTLWKKPELKYGHLRNFLDAKIVFFGPIDFLFGLPININL